MDALEKFLRDVSADVDSIAKKTVEHFGHLEAERFLMTASDGLDIKFALNDCYDDRALLNLVNVQAWGLLKEFKWLQYLFLAGNYPLVKSRLRYIWEAIYRAYHVEAHPDPAVRNLTIDDKLKWLEGQRLNWNNCIQPVLENLLPLAAREQEVIDHYKSLWKQLNQYVHPSDHVQNRMVDDSALLMTDNFDAEWAQDTLSVAHTVTDLIWLAILSFHDKAIPNLSKDDFMFEYPLTSLLLERGGRLE